MIPANAYQERAAMKRDVVWGVLWRLHQPGWPNEGWATSSRVFEAWLDGRDPCGIAYAVDWVGHNFGYLLKRLVADGRAERRKRPGRHPEYRVIDSPLWGRA